MIKFIEYTEEKKKIGVTQQKILKILEASDVALTTKEIAEIKLDNTQVSI